MNRKFSRNEKHKYSNEEKLTLSELVEKYKEEYEAEVNRNEEKTRYDSKRKKHVLIKPITGYVAKVVRSFYSDLAETRNDNPTFVRTVELASRSYNNLVEIFLHVH